MEKCSKKNLNRTVPYNLTKKGEIEVVQAQLVNSSNVSHIFWSCPKLSNYKKYMFYVLKEVFYLLQIILRATPSALLEF